MVSYYRMRRIVLESAPILMFGIVFEIFGGLMVDLAKFSLILFFPVINGVSGSIASILGARLSSRIHLGMVEIKRGNRPLIENARGSILLAIIVFAILSLIISIAYHFTSSSSESIVIFSWIFMSGVLTSLISIVVAIALSGLSVKYGLDPDDVVIPLVTTAADFVGIAILLNMGNLMGLY
jgi:mgtE-like transporter